MRLRSMRIVGLGASLVLSLSACSKDDEQSGIAIEHEVVSADMAAVVCDAYAGCECELGLPESAMCVDAITPSLAASIAQGELLGLRYHEECLDRARAYVSALGCRKSNEIANDVELQQLLFEAQRCKLLTGTGRLADPCTFVDDAGFVALGDTCASGLVCAGVCIAAPERIGDLCGEASVCPLGSSCLDPEGDGVHTCEMPADEGERCNPHDDNGCGPDLVCDPSDVLCIELPGAGDPCPDFVCDSESYCDGMTCQAFIAEGESCATGVCGPGLFCDFMTTTTCTPYPGEGEMCMAGQCAAGFVCGPENICIDTPAVACELPQIVGLCLYRLDGLCDEPEGTGLCEEGTDVEDCFMAGCPSELDGVCDEPEGTGQCEEGTDPDDCGGGGETGGECPSAGDGLCDEPEGSGLCPEGTDPLDCGGECPYAGDGECDEPEGTGLCPEGTDPVDCV